MAPIATSGTIPNDTPHNCGDVMNSNIDPLKDELIDRNPAANLSVIASDAFSISLSNIVINSPDDDDDGSDDDDDDDDESDDDDDDGNVLKNSIFLSI
jgi:hypothetical protein